MEDVRLSRPAVVRIEREHGKDTARVFINGEDVSHHVTAVEWSMRAGRLPTATVVFHDVDVDVAAEDGTEDIAFVTEHPAGPVPITRRQWQQLRVVAPGLVAAIEQARPVERRDKVVPR